MKNRTIFYNFLILCILSGNFAAFSQSDTDSLHNSKSADTAEIIHYVPDSLLRFGRNRYFTGDGSIPTYTTKINPTIAIIASGLYITSAVSVVVVEKNAWWKDQRGSFHFQEDWNSALQVDKLGHAFATYQYAYYVRETMLASGFGWEDAHLYGALVGLGYQTFVESQDGFGGQWGFSPSDWYADALGSMFFLAQHYVPELQKITPKWEYISARLAGRPVMQHPTTPVDDYNSSTFWYSVHLYDLLPRSWEGHYPDWLCLAVGVGADGIAANPDPRFPDKLQSRRYVVGLDVDLVSLLPDSFPFINWLKQSANFFKVPLPTVEFSPSGTKVYLFYPFRVKLGSLKF